jgi:hypothetical protein
MKLSQCTKVSFILSLFVLLSLSGCFGKEDSADWIDWPAIGSEAVYRGDDGSRLTVSVLREEVLRDRFGVSRHALIFGYLMHPAAAPDVDIKYEEAIDIKTGLHIRQDLYCLFGRAISQVEEPCDEDRMRIFFGGDGLPGALGLGPFYGSGPPPASGSDVFLGYSHRELITDATYEVQPLAGGCLGIRVNSAFDPALLPSFLPGTVWDRPFEACPGEPFPVRFQSLMAMPKSLSSTTWPIFDRIEFYQGDQTLTIPEERPVTEPEAPERRTGPTAFTSGMTGIINYSSLQAHKKALELDADYRKIFEQGGALVDLQYRTGGRYDPGGPLLPLPIEEYDTWRIDLRARNGSAYLVEVEKTTKTHFDGSRSISYDITHREKHQAEDPPTLLWEDGLIDPHRAYAYGESLFGGDILGIFHRFRGWPLDIHAEGEWHPSLPTVIIHFRPMDHDGYWLTDPVGLSMDVHTGGLISLRLSPDHRPYV